MNLLTGFIQVKPDSITDSCYKLSFNMQLHPFRRDFRLAGGGYPAQLQPIWWNETEVEYVSDTV